MGEVATLDTMNTANTDLTKINRIIISILAILGVLVCIELLVVYYNANFNPAAEPSFCSINEHIDCDAVAETGFSRLLEVPLALWGLGFYSFILFLSVFPFDKFDIFKPVSHPKAFIFILSVFSIILSLILYYITSYIIEKVCILCYVLYLLNAGLFFASKVGTPIEKHFVNAFADIKAMLSDRRWWLLLGIPALIGVIALVLINIYKPFTPPETSMIAKSVPRQQCSTPNRMNSGGGNPYALGTIGNILGDKDAKLIIHEYTDYQCPYCAMSNEMLLRLSKEVKGIKIVHHDFPLDKECNPYIRGSVHPMACQAAYYAKAAKMQGKFWDMATLLYEHKDELSEEKILQLAKKLDLDINKLKKDVADNKEIFKQEIVQDIEKAKKLGISGTPTIVIGIKKYEGAMPYPKLKQTVLENLQQ